MTNSACPKVFVVILTHNSRRVVGACLRSVTRMDYPNFEIIVADNASSDGTLEYTKAMFPRLNFIRNGTNSGFARGNNTAIRHALEKMADYIFLLNPDTVVEQNTLSLLVEEAEKDQPKKAGIWSPIIFQGGTNKIWFAGGKIDWLKMRAVHNLPETVTKDSFSTEFISGCAMLIGKNVFQEIGILDEQYFLYYEDADFCFRARKKGFSLVVVPSASIQHFESSRLGETKIYWLVFSGLLFFQKNAPWYFRVYYFFYLILRKIKNKRDIEIHHKGSAYIVNRAYKDYAAFAKNN